MNKSPFLRASFRRNGLLHVVVRRSCTKLVPDQAQRMDNTQDFCFIHKRWEPRSTAHSHRKAHQFDLNLRNDLIRESVNDQHEEHSPERYLSLRLNYWNFLPNPIVSLLLQKPCLQMNQWMLRISLRSKRISCMIFLRLIFIL